MKNQFLLKVFQHINKCRSVDEVALLIAVQLLLAGMQYIKAKMGSSLKFITKALVFVQSRLPFLPTFESSKHQYNN